MGQIYLNVGQDIVNPPFPLQHKVLFQVALMILKFIETPLLSCNDEAEAISILNEFLANLGKKPSQENKVQQDEEAVKVTSLSPSPSLTHLTLTAHSARLQSPFTNY